MSLTSDIRLEIEQMCEELGSNSMLVQGAGGNVSWKENDTLWVKASGTWLANASTEDIFVAVDLENVKDKINQGKFSDTPVFQASSGLRPSIETLLHALMPQKIVVHVHSVEALVALVRSDSAQALCQKISDSLNWCKVGYHKPGSELARSIAHELKESFETNIVFMQNHGIVIGGESVFEVKNLLNEIVTSLQGNLIPETRKTLQPNPFPLSQYSLISDPYIQELALDPSLLAHVRCNWAISPDHVVFLGSEPVIYEKLPGMHDSDAAELIFIPNKGVFCRESFNATKLAQLRCYFDVMSRLPEGSNVTVLNDEDISDLLNWDAEKLRQSMAMD